LTCHLAQALNGLTDVSDRLACTFSDIADRLTGALADLAHGLAGTFA
jgi:hypothetical protein